ncbi:MAG: phosphoribosylamine--glycine ligase [Chitinophagales bacterium]|nr:phosphoribosylamine--glycine ligase [Chitinophagales bacterium]
MNILIIGSGGREHAIAQKISESKQTEKLFISPGNIGTALVGTNIELKNFEAIGHFCIQEDINMVVVGPETPLVDGIYDYFVNNTSLQHISVIGPSQQGAMLEGSKSFCKSFLIRHHIPTAAYIEVNKNNLEAGLTFLDSQQAPYVLKADGLAAGKGVLICSTLDEAKTELQNMLSGKFGSASEKVVIEEFMNGIEFSVFVLSDGNNYKILPIAKDYKRIGEQDTGLNTGGMGAVSPPPFVTEAIMQDVEQQIIIPTINGLKKDNITYKGFIYIGLMLSKDNVAKVVEYNCRMGDPETQAVFPRITSDVVNLFDAVGNGNLNEVELSISDEAAVTVILASDGYPEAFEKGNVITNTTTVEDAFVFHAGTALNEQGELINNGGRVIAVTALDNDWQVALAKANNAATHIDYKNKYYRKDIGFDLK